jgi:CelD/BcsL family acetyltransferase involved in cellulose biosynthesis
MWTVYAADEFNGAQRAAWEIMNREYYGSHPLYDSKFVAPLLKYFSDGELVLAVERQEDAPIGAALLRHQGKGVWQLFLPSQAQLGLAMFAAAPSADDMDARLEGLLKRLPGFAWMLGLVNQDSEFSPVAKSYASARSEVRQHTVTVSIGVKGTFDAYWQSRSKNMTGGIERRLRKAERETAQVRLVVRRSEIDVAEAVAAHGDIESAGWKGTVGTAMHRDNLQGRFYTEVMRNFARDNGACAYQLYLGDTLAASLLTIAQSGMMVLLKTAHVETLSAYGPGRLLDFLTLRHIFEEGAVRRIEYYTKASADDMRWSTESRGIQHVTFYRSRLLRGAVALARRYRRGSAKASTASAVPG